MLKITIISVGDEKEQYFREASQEYLKRLSKYAEVSLIILKDEPIPDNAKEKEKEQILVREGEKIKEKIPKGAAVVTLCVEGKQLSSEELAKKIEELSYISSHICFIIGGSLGLSQEVKDLSVFKLSVSKLTFPHRLMRVILAEALYRAESISNGGKYHK